MGWGEKDGGGERERKIKDGEGKEANKWEIRGAKKQKLGYNGRNQPSLRAYITSQAQCTCLILFHYIFRTKQVSLSPISDSRGVKELAQASHAK